MRVLLLVLGLGPLTPAVAPASVVPRAPVAPARTAPAGVDAAEEQYRFVLGLSEQGLWIQVVREARAFLGAHPTSGRADPVRYRLGTALYELGRAREAALELEPLAGRAGFTLWREAAYRLAQCRLAEGETKRAIEALERLLAGGADYLALPATLALADARLETGEFAAAEQGYLSLAPSADPKLAADVAWGLAWCAYRLDRGELVLTRAAAFLARHASDERAPEMRFLQGEVELARGRHDDALAAYRAVRAGPLAVPALRGSGLAHSGAGRHAEAARAFDAAFQAEPDGRYATECALHAGVEHLKAGATALALERLEQRRLDDDPEALYWRARARAEAGRHADALAALERALAQTPAPELERRARAARGDALAALGRKDEAVRAWAEAGSQRGLHNAAVLSLDAGRYREAAELAERLLQEAPGANGDVAGRAELALVLGEAHFALGDYDAADRAFARALEEQGPRGAGANDTSAQGPVGGIDRAHAELRRAWCRWFAEDAAGAAERFAGVAQGGTKESPEAQFMLARARLASGDEAAAARAFQGYLERFPEGPKRADALLALSRLEPGAAGTARLEALLAEHPASPLAPEARLALAERCAAAGDRARAERLYQELLRGPPGPEVPAARYGLAWSLMDAGAYDDAARELEPLTADVNANAPTELELAAGELAVWCAARRGDAQGASAAWSRLADWTPDPARLFAAARPAIEVLRAAGETERASGIVTRLFALERLRPDPAVAAGLALERVYLELDRARPAEAEAALDAAREALPRAPEPVTARVAEAAFFVGEARFDAGEYERAAALYDAASMGGDGLVAERALYKGGFARLSQGDAAGAAERFRRLVDEHPESPLRLESIFLLGEAECRAGRFEEAIASLERLRRTARGHEVLPKALFRLGLAYGALERWTECAEVLTELAQEHGGPDRDHPERETFANLAEAELWRGRALARLGDGAAARRALARVLALERGDLAARARVELGRLARAEGDLDGALSEFLKVSVLYETETVAEALLYAAEVLFEQGDPTAAAGRYQDLIGGYPESAHARTARERLRELRGR